MSLPCNSLSASPRVRPEWPEPSKQLRLAGEVLEAVLSFRREICRSADDSFELVVESYESGDWQQALSGAATLADGGHPAAANLALLMLRYGAPLYGIGLHAEPRRIAGWAKLVLQAKEPARREISLVSRSAESPKLSGARPQQLGQCDPRSTSRRTASPRSITAIA